ncbi:MAG: hypothetical protein KatS3mg102_1808 [Planctomycetota bacterium]|nr:MAG: hypothetical protein KatS3mg102_1808 [Planctomycetota bacterium]
MTAGGGNPDRTRGRVHLGTLALLAAVVLYAATAPLASADVIYLLNGGRLEGRIVAEDERFVHIETAVGVQRIDREEIDRIERLDDPRAEFQRRARALERFGSAEEWYQLGVWAAEQGLAEQARQAWERAVVLDPHHEGARERLGHVFFRGRWMTEAEARRAQGYVEHEGRWVTPAEKAMLQAGYVLVDGEWVHRNTLIERARRAALERARELARRREAEEQGRARQERVAGGRRSGSAGEQAGAAAGDEAQPEARPLRPRGAGEPPSPEQLARWLEAQKQQARQAEEILGLKFQDIEEGPLLIHTTQPVDSERFRSFLRDLGRLYKLETQIYNLPFDAPIWPGKLQIYFFKDKAEFDAFATRIDDAPGAVQSGGYFIHGADARGQAIFHICMYNTDVGTLAHEMSHAFMARFNYSRKVVMPWINEGVAEFLRVSVAKEFGLGRAGDSSQLVAVREMLRRNDPRASLAHMMEKADIAGTEGWAYAVSWSLIDFMVAADKKAFVRFLKAVKQSDGSFQGDWTPADAEAQKRAIEEAFGVSLERFEQAWRSHVQGKR